MPTLHQQLRSEGFNPGRGHPGMETNIMSTFTGIEIASRALRVSQNVLDVVGHNISNVNTPGYSRQTASIVASPSDTAYDVGSSNFAAQIGTGVDLASVTRVRDAFIEQRLQDATGNQSKYNTLRDGLQRVQDTFNELSTDGLGKQITATFNAFQEVSRAPEGDAARSLLRSQGENVSRRFRDVLTGLNNIDDDLKGQGAIILGQVSDLAKQVADLNGQIHITTIMGGHANDLEDKRDQVVRQLSDLVGASAVPEHDPRGNPTGNVTVSVNGFTLVEGSRTNALPSTFAVQAGVPQLTDGTLFIPIKSGIVSGLIATSDRIKTYKADLNTVASTFITEVNAQHKLGYGLDGLTNRAFFTGTDASDIAVDPAIEADLKAIAASSPPLAGGTVAPSNGDNARAISDISKKQLFGNQTIVTYQAAKITQLGADAQSYDRQASNQDKVVQQLQNLRDSTSGVSLDEELTHMLQYQRSYQAASKLVTTYDDMIQTIINMVK